MNYMYLLNLIFAATILVLGIKRFLQTDVKAFLFIGLAYALFGFSHLAVLMGWTGIPAILSGVRTAGYIMVIIGLII